MAWSQNKQPLITVVALSPGLLDEPQVLHNNRVRQRLRHVVDGEGRDRAARQGLHLDPGSMRRRDGAGHLQGTLFRILLESHVAGVERDGVAERY